MKITAELLRTHHACEQQVLVFERIYPDGCEPTTANLIAAAAVGFDSWWLINLLPTEGIGSKLDYTLWAAEQVLYLTTDERVKKCIETIRNKINDPKSVYKDELRQSSEGAWAAAIELSEVSAFEAAAGAASAIALVAEVAYLAADAVESYKIICESLDSYDVVADIDDVAVYYEAVQNAAYAAEKSEFIAYTAAGLGAGTGVVAENARVTMRERQLHKLSEILLAL